MDERGLTYDPNRDPLAPVQWYEEIGPTTKPSPYNRASWVCVQEHYKEGTIVPLPGSDPVVGLETNHIYASVKVYDREASNPNVEGLVYTQETDGHLIGHLDYEIVGSLMTLTDWSHHGWYDSSPIEFAFRTLIINTPPCVNQVIVREPEAFWKSLGFIHPNKDADFLVFNEKIITPVPY